MSTYHIWTIGCQMNTSDSLRLSEALERLGYLPAARLEDADVMVMNTCVVRQSAQDKVVGRLSSLKPVKRRRPDAVLAVMGCFVGQRDSEQELRTSFPFVDLLLSPSDHTPLIEYLVRQRPIVPCPTTASGPVPVSAYVTIMQGCNNFCSYCIVPFTRGREKSRPIAEIVEEVSDLAVRGAREITLLGQNVDSFGRTLPGRPSLADLLREAHHVDGLLRLRFLTSHPKDMTPELIRTVAQLPKACEHIELPIQSGDDVMLRRMNRGYTVAQFRDLVRDIRATIPDVSLATDVVVGFPGETAAQFDATFGLLQEIRFDAVHVAAYSPRTGTSASRLIDDVPADDKERRRRVVEELQERVVGEINARLLGQTVEILVEERQKGKWRGRTRSNRIVFFSDPRDWRGQLASIRITWTGPWSLQGTVA